MTAIKIIYFTSNLNNYDIKIINQIKKYSNIINTGFNTLFEKIILIYKKKLYYIYIGYYYNIPECRYKFYKNIICNKDFIIYNSNPEYYNKKNISYLQNNILLYPYVAENSTLLTRYYKQEEKYYKIIIKSFCSSIIKIKDLYNIIFLYYYRVGYN